MGKKAQAGIEYMIIIGFVTIAITSILVMAIFYSDQVKDRVRMNQAENFVIQLINSAEGVFFAGEPSKTTVRLYLPSGVQAIEINTNDITVTMNLHSGSNVRVYESRVPLSGSVSVSEGLKKLSLIAEQDYVSVS